MFKVGDRVHFHLNGEVVQGIVMEKNGENFIIKMLDNSTIVVNELNVITR
jgi:hypothetical protein